ncbi:hypothetical protein LX36DRAFT_703961 [Colletotrichum falcatum]|nr:hypothetical protein LX36DRAFT_703961 [Colletotrichum falcatum]
MAAGIPPPLIHPPCQNETTTQTTIQAPPPPAKGSEKPTDRDRRGMDPTTRTRLLKACADILQIVSPSSFTNQSARDPLEHRLQRLMRCAAFAVQAAAAEEDQLTNRESALDTNNGDQEEKGGLVESDVVQH